MTIFPQIKLRPWTPAILFTSLTLLLTQSLSRAAAPEPTPVLGSASYQAGVPTGPSPMNGKFYSIDIFYFDAGGTLASSTVTVPGINPPAGNTPQQIKAAQVAKAKAIVDAVNAANLNGVTATVNAKDPTQYTFNGVRQSLVEIMFPLPGGPQKRLGPASFRTKGNTVTGETGDGTFNFKPTPGTGDGTSQFKGALDGNNDGTMTAGLDYSGNPSVIGFGFIDNTTSTPVSYVTNFNPTPGMDDADVLGELATLFNTAYATDGFTASYDPTQDVLSIDQPLPDVDELIESDSDTNLDLQTDFTDVPEPSSLALLSALSLTLLPRRRNPGCTYGGFLPIRH